jgi:hypothetical protein
MVVSKVVWKVDWLAQLKVETMEQDSIESLLAVTYILGYKECIVSWR